MPFVDRNGIRIHYKVEGKGPAIVMLYGFTGAIDTWYKYSYVDALKQDYQLVLIDLRGHGKSDKPHDPELYLMKEFTADTIAIMDKLEIEKAHFWGYSFGGYLGLCLTKYYPNRFLSFLFGGISPQELTEEVWDAVRKLHDSLKAGKEAYISRLVKGGREITPEKRAELESFDYKALAAILSSKDIFLPMDEHLPELDIPVLFYAGEDDEYGHFPRQLEIGKKMKNVKVVGIPNHGHAVQRQKDLVLPHILEFLEEINK